MGGWVVSVGVVDKVFMTVFFAARSPCGRASGVGVRDTGSPRFLVDGLFLA